MDQTIDLIIEKPKKRPASDRLIAAAGPLFADSPFDAVSTRELANAAQVNLSAISYHFGNKEGLYEAVFKNLLNELKPIREGMATFLGVAIEPAIGNKGMQRSIIRSLVGMFLDSLTSSKHPQWHMRLMLREIQQPGRCFDLVMNGHINIVHNLIGELVSSITGNTENSPSVIITSHTIIGMCLQYRLNEAILAHRLSWRDYGAAEIAIIKNETSKMIIAILGLTEPAT
ncbi:MAG: CerR family C-terminal domain-containing protein [Sneathiella sp.]|nr:CerR family C-terminal domain-containing protein [Sneathiella sp.]